MDDLGLLTAPRCPWCGERMERTIRFTHGAPEPPLPSLEEHRRAYRPAVPFRTGPDEVAGASDEVRYGPRTVSRASLERLRETGGLSAAAG
jgi:hypothetical protein